MITVGFAAFVFVALPLRIFLAAVGIADWTMAWRTVNYITYPLVMPVDLLSPFEANLVGDVRLTEVASLLLFSALAGYLLALLTVRRRG